MATHASVPRFQHTTRSLRVAPRLAATNIVPGGSRSQTSTLCNGHGAGPKTFGSNVAVPPGGIFGVLVRSVSAIRPCTPAVMSVVALAIVRDPGASGVEVVTVALLRIVPRTCGRAVTMIVARAPDPIDASLHLSGLRPGQEPLEGWTETIDTAVENVSVTVGVLAIAGPAFVTMIVYRSVDPIRARVWSTVLVIVSFASRGGAAGGVGAEALDAPASFTLARTWRW